jgi:hypothetical protein
MRPVGSREGDAILGAMRQVALAGGRPLGHADTASLVAAATCPASGRRISCSS